jgi:hypothetical protein
MRSTDSHWMARSLIVFAAVFAGMACAAEKPLFRDFLAINGHTVQFKPKLYAPVCRVVRDYHPVQWDLGQDSKHPLEFPMARNRVSWQEVYGSWRKEGYFIDACLMFETLKVAEWKDLAADTHTYGYEFAKNLGPQSRALVDAVEIGNEPGSFNDTQYRTIFENMAKGVREGDSKLKIATCNVKVGKSGDYHKSVDCVKGLEGLYDVLNTHVYAMAENWPTWKRSYPEDSKITFLKEVDELLAWRDANAPGKELWITEFGWDASTQPAPKTGTFSKWMDNTDTEQAQWLVRSFFVFARRDVARAFIYFFDDNDTPQFHGSSGITRRFQPKESYHALAHLFKTLGDYRFSRVVKETGGDAYVYEFVNGADANKIVWAAWSPTGSGRTAELTLPLENLKFQKAERMPLKPGDVPAVEIKTENNALKLPLEEAPLYLFLER